MTDSLQQDHEPLIQGVQFVKGVGPRRAVALNKLGIRSAADLLFYFPQRYEDFSGKKHISEIEIGQTETVVGSVEDIDHRQSGPRHILYVLLEQDRCFVRGVWFNQPFLLKKFRLGQTVQFRGKVSERGGRLQINHPQIVWLEDESEKDEVGLRPVYRLTAGIKQLQMRRMIAGAVEELTGHVKEAIPKELQSKVNLCQIDRAIHWIHNPQNEKQLGIARRRLVFQECLVLQLALSMRRFKINSRSVAQPMELTPKIRARILGRLPFELRASQREAFTQIAEDMGKAVPMNRLLHGEVGSGKTMIAFCSMMLVAANGCQSVLMAPTEILARQHYQNLKCLLTDSRIRIEFVSGSQNQSKRNQLQKDIADGQVDILVGTTAVLSEKLQLPRLALIVIDEQHKFGVRQRAQLKESGFDPHYLIMTATPIPRTITMTLFGDLEVSVLPRTDVKRTVHTYLGNKKNKEKWLQFFRQKLDEGRSGYVVAPFVETNKDTEIQSAESMFESMANGSLNEYRIGMLHGRMSADEKQDVMSRFAGGDFQVLVATGVIEVGIDVPEATVMTIESAERFGLAQLHQLRGRVGRGRHPGFVCVFPTEENDENQQRLQAFVDCDNGFDLAEMDLKLRGPGNLLSTKQTGFPPLKIADLVEDEAVLREARQCAREIIADDPNLAKLQHERLRTLVMNRYAKVLGLGDVG